MVASGSRCALIVFLAATAWAPGFARAGGRLAVAAASSLEPAFAELSAAFRASHGGASVVATFGATGTFFAQIENGAPFDVLLAADRDAPGRLVAGGLASGEVIYARGALVLWTSPRAAALPWGSGLAPLASPSIRRIAIANPRTAPYGRAAEEVLRRSGVYAAVAPKLVVAESALQAAQLARTGAVDAALVPRPLAAAGALPEGGVRALPGGAPIEYAAVALARSRDPPLARAFVEFLRGAEAKAILARHGYEP